MNLPQNINDKAIKVLQEYVTLADKQRFQQLVNKHGLRNWISFVSVLELPNGKKIPRGHFEYGMKIRNYLREQVCLDADLPSGNWDDYYLTLLEIACDLRKE